MSIIHSDHQFKNGPVSYTLQVIKHGLSASSLLDRGVQLMGENNRYLTFIIITSSWKILIGMCGLFLFFIFFVLFFALKS